MTLEAKHEDVYCNHSSFGKLKEKSRTLYNEYSQQYLMGWVRKLHRGAVKRHQEIDESVKMLNATRQRAEHLILWHFK